MISSLQRILSYSENIYSWLSTVVRTFGSLGRLTLNFSCLEFSEFSDTLMPSCGLELESLRFPFFSRDLASVETLRPLVEVKLCIGLIDESCRPVPMVSAWSILSAIIRAAIVMVFMVFASVLMSMKLSMKLRAAENVYLFKFMLLQILPSMFRHCPLSLINSWLRIYS